MPDTKLRLPLGVTGWTVYTRLKDESGQIWNSTTSAYVAYVLANIANFKLATPETPAGSGDYEATMPAGSAAGNYSWSHYRLIGSNPAASDPLLGSGGDYWNGTTFGAADASASIFGRAIGGGDFEAAITAMAAVLAGKITQSADGTVNTFSDFLDDNTTRVTSTSSQTTRAVEIE
jgi:hypothetical protein